MYKKDDEREEERPGHNAEAKGTAQPHGTEFTTEPPLSHHVTESQQIPYDERDHKGIHFATCLCYSISLYHYHGRRSLSTLLIGLGVAVLNLHDDVKSDAVASSYKSPCQENCWCV